MGKRYKSLKRKHEVPEYCPLYLSSPVGIWHRQREVIHRRGAKCLPEATSIRFMYHGVQEMVSNPEQDNPKYDEPNKRRQ